MKPLYIFDLDGTLADASHRQPILDDKDNPNRWREFYALCDKDTPIQHVIDTMERLRSYADIFIFSGRSDEVRDKTIAWLAHHTSFMTHDLDSPILQMRAAGDYTADDVLKKQWLDSMLDDDRRRLVAAFDDRDRVVQMWRANGVPCFQVADGEF